MTSYVKAGLAAIVLATLPGAALAQIVVGGSDGNLRDPVGETSGSVVTYTNADGRPGDEKATLGVPQGGPASFVSFTGSATQTVTTDTQFSLGTLSYFNGTSVQGSSIRSIILDITTALTLNGATTSAGPFSFTLGVDNTPNATPCEFPSVTPCSDRLRISQGVQSSTFLFNGQELSLFVDGFRASDGSIFDNLIIDERATVSGNLIGRFSLAQGAVPEPSTWAMLIFGFGALGATMRRDRRRGQALQA